MSARLRSGHGVRFIAQPDSWRYAKLTGFCLVAAPSVPAGIRTPNLLRFMQALYLSRETQPLSYRDSRLLLSS